MTIHTFYNLILKRIHNVSHKNESTCIGNSYIGAFLFVSYSRNNLKNKIGTLYEP